MTERCDETSIWRILSEKVIHDSPWMKLTIADVRLPDGTIIEHRIVRYPGPTAGVLMHDPDTESVLLVWRHRFITDHWGWEVPAGLGEPGESPEVAAVREAAEETGYSAVNPRPLVEIDTSSGLMDETFHCFYADRWLRVGSAEADVESARICWIPISRLNALIQDGKLRHAHSLTAVLKAMHDGLIAAT